MAWQWQSPGDARPWLSQSLASSTVYTEDDPSGACDTTKNPSPHGQSVAGYTLMGLEGVLFEIKTSPPLCWRRKCDVSWFRSHFSKLMFEAKVRGEKHQCNSLRFSSLNQGSLVFTAGLSCQNPRSLAQSDLGFHTCDLRGIFMSVPYRSTPSRHLHALYL